jgi:hypothetical protein
MKRTIVRYRTKPDSVEENARLIEDVFATLRESSPPGIRYAVFRLDDGTFVHISEAGNGARPLPELDAFRRFQKGVKERSLEPPQACGAVVVGNYRMLAAAGTD